MLKDGGDMTKGEHHHTVRRLIVALVVVLGMAAPLTAGAQAIQPGELPTIDHDTRAVIVDGVCDAIAKAYVLGEPAEGIVKYLKQQLADGQYDQFNDPDFPARIRPR